MRTGGLRSRGAGRETSSQPSRSSRPSGALVAGSAGSPDSARAPAGGGLGSSQVTEEPGYHCPRCLTPFPDDEHDDERAGWTETPLGPVWAGCSTPRDRELEDGPSGT